MSGESQAALFTKVSQNGVASDEAIVSKARPSRPETGCVSMLVETLLHMANTWFETENPDI